MTGKLLAATEDTLSRISNCSVMFLYNSSLASQYAPPRWGIEAQTRTCLNSMSALVFLKKNDPTRDGNHDRTPNFIILDATQVTTELTDLIH